MYTEDLQHYREAIIELANHLPASNASGGLDRLQSIFWQYSCMIRKLNNNPAFRGFDNPGSMPELGSIDSCLIEASDGNSGWERSKAFYDAKKQLQTGLEELIRLLGSPFQEKYVAD